MSSSMTVGKTVSRGEPLPHAARAYVTKLFRELGEAETLERLKMSRSTLYRIMAGLTVYQGTHALVERDMEDSK